MEVVAARQLVDDARTPDEVAHAQRRFEALRDSLNELVDRAFGLTEVDLEAIEAVPAP